MSNLKRRYNSQRCKICGCKYGSSYISYSEECCLGCWHKIPDYIEGHIQKMKFIKLKKRKIKNEKFR